MISAVIERNSIAFRLADRGGTDGYSRNGLEVPFCSCGEHFRFAPNSGTKADIPESSVWANKRLMQRNKDRDAPFRDLGKLM